MSFQQSAEEAVGGAKAGVQHRRQRTLATTWLAWSIWVLAVFFGIVYALLVSANPHNMGFSPGTVPAWFVPFVLMFPTVGALIASRDPHNLIGWFFLGGILVLAGASANQYGVYTLSTNPGSLPGGLEITWTGLWLTNTGAFLMFILAVLLFPSGHLPSRRWRSVAWLVAAFLVLDNLVLAFKPGLMINNVAVSRNPFGIDQFAGPLEFFDTRLADPIYVGLIIASAVSLIERFRHAQSKERQQLKWIAYASAFLMLTVATIGVLQWLLQIREKPGYATLANLLYAVMALAIAAFPVAVGIAILRHHLFDIDLIINRTLVYVPLTAILAGLYSSSIVLFQKLFIAVTGEKSDAAIVLTTLILATSFTPIKNGLQGVVDRRFKETPDATKRLIALGKEVESRIYAVDVYQVTRRLLDEAVRAFSAQSGALYLERGGRLELAQVYGEWADRDARLAIPLEGGGKRLGLLELGVRDNGQDYTEKDLQTLQDISAVVADAIKSVENVK